MAQLDRYIELVFKHQAEKLILKSGEKTHLIVAGRVRALSTPAPAEKDLDQLLGEVVPDELKTEILQSGEHAFQYSAPQGEVTLRLQRQEGALRIEIVAGAAEKKTSAPKVASSPAQVSTTTSVGADTSAMDALFREMIAEGCSDLHLTSGQPPIFRKDGSMQKLSRTDLIPAEAMRPLLYSITPKNRQKEIEEKMDTDFSYEIPGLARFRCNLFVDRNGIGGVFRQIPADILTAKDLNLSEYILDLCKLHKGLVVVTGPTGSGKSTTLAAMVDHINETRSDHIITIEDPIEFVHPTKKCLINQREIDNHTLGFKPALRAALREDPDIVLVGEMRDLETVEIAIETAETGHLVFGTLHTNTAPSTVDRVIDQFPTDRQGQIRTMLSESLKGVIAQTLCKKKGGGRIAALEVLIVTSAVRNLIREGKTHQIPSSMQTGAKVGMQTLNDALLQLVKDDLVEPHEAYAKAVARAEFLGMLKGAGFEIDVPDDS